MSASMADGVRLGIPQIAEIAGVTPNAITNWRKRHHDFPTPVVSSPSGMLFDAAQVERWLIENSKITSRVPAEILLWPFIDSIRHESHDIDLLIGAAIVYVAVNDKARDGHEPQIPTSTLWPAIRERPDRELGAALRQAAEDIERHRPVLSETITRGLAAARELSGTSLRRLIDLVDSATSPRDGTLAAGALFDQARQHFHDLDRWSENTATPPSLERLFGQLTEDAATVFDPACGEAGSLVLAARLHESTQRRRPLHLIGWEINERAAITARARAYLYDVDADIVICNSLTSQPVPAGIDVVIADPPLGVRDWGTADDYVNPRWQYGAPTPSSADMAWLQIALESLSQNGRAYVALAPGSLYSQGAEATVRSRMLDAGVVDAIVALPARLRRDTSIPLVLWALQPPGPAHDVLIVDASSIGTPGRSTVTLDTSEISAIAGLLLDRRRGQPNITAADQRIQLTVLERDEISMNGDVLDPGRYRRVEPPSHRELLDRRAAAAKAVTDAAATARNTLDRLLDQLGGHR